MVEGFVNPQTFHLQEDEDPISVNCKELAQSVHCNRHCAVNYTNPEIESLPTLLLPQLANLIDSNEAAARLAENMPDLMDTDGNVVTGQPEHHPADQAPPLQRIVGRRNFSQRSPR